MTRWTKPAFMLVVWGAVAVAAAMLLSPFAHTAEVKVLSGNGPRAAVAELCAQFAKATGHKVDIVLAVNADVIRRAEAGEHFDVVVGNPPTIDRLIKSGKAEAGSRADFGKARLAAAVRQGAPRPDISSVDAFKKTLLAAKAVAYPGEGASGRYFVSLLDRMGIKDQMQGRLKPMPAEDAIEVVARGEADLAVAVSSRIQDVAGVETVGPIPQELQTVIGFAAGLSAAPRDKEAARALVRFLSGPEARATLKAKGIQPVP